MTLEEKLREKIGEAIRTGDVCVLHDGGTSEGCFGCFNEPPLVTLYSHRGHPLLYYVRNDEIAKYGPRTVDIVTVENYDKWYGLQIVHPDNSVEEVPFPDMGNYEILGSPFRDHVPNPAHITAKWPYDDRRFMVHNRALDIIAGRWLREACS